MLVAADGFLLVDKFKRQATTPEVDVTDKSVAVLPFVAMSRGEDDEYFADGLTEEILNSLTRVPELLVTARTSAFHFKGRDIPVPEIAEPTRICYVQITTPISCYRRSITRKSRWRSRRPRTRGW